MRVAVVTTQVPFVYARPDFIADSLQQILREHGHSCQIVRIPFKCYPAQKLLEHMLASRLVRVANADRIIALRFPAYYVEHDNKVLWLLHHFRQAYDLWGTAYQEIPNTGAGLAIRDAVINTDNHYLRRV